MLSFHFGHTGFRSTPGGSIACHTSAGSLATVTILIFVFGFAGRLVRRGVRVLIRVLIRIRSLPESIRILAGGLLLRLGRRRVLRQRKRGQKRQ